MAGTTIPETALNAVLGGLDHGNRRYAERFPGDSPRRQPVHVVYGGAHLFAADTVQKLAAIARRTLSEHAPDPARLAAAFAIDGALAERIYPRLADKLQREAVEDYRIDFEDGFGHRPDEEEDKFAGVAARAVAEGLGQGTLPHGIGIRIKPLGDEHKRRSLRTLDLFLTELLEHRVERSRRTSSSPCRRSPRSSRSPHSRVPATPSSTGASCRTARFVSR